MCQLLVRLDFTAALEINSICIQQPIYRLQVIAGWAVQALAKMGRWESIFSALSSDKELSRATSIGGRSGRAASSLVSALPQQQSRCTPCVLCLYMPFATCLLTGRLGPVFQCWTVANPQVDASG